MLRRADRRRAERQRETGTQRNEAREGGVRWEVEENHGVSPAGDLDLKMQKRGTKERPDHQPFSEN